MRGAVVREDRPVTASRVSGEHAPALLFTIVCMYPSDIHSLSARSHAARVHYNETAFTCLRHDRLARYAPLDSTGTDTTYSDRAPFLQHAARPTGAEV